MSEPEESLDGIDSRSLVIIGLFGIILTFVLMVGVQVMFYRMEKVDFLRKVVRPGCSEVKEAQAGWQMTLNKYRWTEADHQAAAIPIERAMGQVVTDLAAHRR